MAGKSVALSSTVVLSRDQVSSDLADEVVVLNLASGIYYGLDPVGARVWDLMRQPTTVTAIRDALVGEYDVDGNRCERALLALLHSLAAERLIDVLEVDGEPR